MLHHYVILTLCNFQKTKLDSIHNMCMNISIMICVNTTYVSILVSRQFLLRYS